jgi:hypothetical protein
MTPPISLDKPMLKAEDVARLLNLPLRWVQNNAEKLGGVKLGKYWRFDHGCLLAKIGEMVLRNQGPEGGEASNPGRQVRLRDKRRRNPGIHRSQKKGKNPHDPFPL